ncbi:MAG: EVE domain-containing protein [Gemmatimonadetes bacterium]|nr:MAG: EVE domain-containing protein [Gemmatimonadota bacterium]
MAYWLMKSEPDVYSIDDLARDGTTCWDGVRNFQARNHMKTMKVGDEVLYYHSRQTPPAVVGRARVVREAYPDHTQFDASSKYHDPRASADAPRWFMVDIEFVEKFERPVPLPELKTVPALADMVLLNNARLSVQPVRPEEWRAVLDRAR